MPNMDDISFFSSSDYSHRGGIWADAARRERQHTTLDGTTDLNTQLPQVQVETSPGSLSTTLVSPPPPAHDEDNGDQGREHPDGGLRKDESFETSSPPRSIISAIAQTASTSSSATRRRSWFLPARDEDSNTESEPSPPRTDDAPNRGRHEEVTHDTSSSPRSASPHSDTGLVPYDTRSEPSSLPKTPPPLPRRRGLPQQQPETDEPVPAPSRSPQSLLGRVGTNTTISSNGSTTSSFFSTLKARATDKEALSQSAKETMKKWSANWANLKKGPPDEPAPGTNDGQPKGSSFAEVRKHVEERHRTIITAGNPTGTSDTPSSSATGRTSTPPRTQGGSRRLSIPGSLSAGSSTSTSDLVSNSVSQDPLADRDDSSRDREGETDVTPPAPAPHPIYTQPSAPKMMMIPGIHASHRGEVQSMGYVAPTPEPAEPKLKAPAIQNVYRLWKNPGSSQTMPPASKEPTESLHLGGGDAGSPPSQGDLPVSTSSSPPSSSSPNSKRGVPPPLPARTAVIRPLETSVTKASPDPAEFGNLTASAALKSIVSQDSGSRRHSSSSFDNLDNLQPPPTAATGNL